MTRISAAAGLPLLLALALPPRAIWWALGAGFAAAVLLLRLTPGFRFAELWRVPPPAAFAAASILGAAALAVSVAAAKAETVLKFVPHSGPFARGIFATVQAKATGPVSAAGLREHFDAQYADSPFVRVVDGSPKLKNVVASNMAEVAVAVSDDTVVVMSAIDNLVKGAAGGAMQWMNRLFGQPDTAGLTGIPPGWT